MMVSPLETARSTSRLMWGEEFAFEENTRTITRLSLIPSTIAAP